jgi:hypothetical protein
MEVMKKWLLSFWGLAVVGVLVFPDSVGATRGLDYLVVNVERNQCGIYYEGDEFVSYELKAGWEIVYPETCGERLTIATDEARAKGCCDKLGMEFVGINVGMTGAGTYSDWHYEWNRYEMVKWIANNVEIWGSIVVILGGVGIILAWAVRKKWWQKSKVKLRTKLKSG